MTNLNLQKEVTLTLSLGHLLMVWNILSNKVSCSPFNHNFSEEEKRTIWALEDLCETGLINNGIESLPENEWNQLIESARDFVKTLPVEFVDG